MVAAKLSYHGAGWCEGYRQGGCTWGCNGKRVGTGRGGERLASRSAADRRLARGCTKRG